MKRIAVIMGGLVYDSQRKILEGIYHKMAELHGCVYAFTCHVLESSGERILKGAGEIYRFADFTNFDGVVFAPNTIVCQETRAWLVENIKKTGIPAVCIDYNQEGIASIVADNYNAMYELVEHLVTVHGKRRFFYLDGPQGNSDASQRKQAFLDALEKYQVPLDAIQIFQGNFAPESGKKAWDFWKSELGVLPDAIVCANDAMAQGIMTELRQDNVKVPEEVTVTGVDNSRTAVESEPRLTSIERFYYKMGVQACQLLQQAAQGKDITGERLKLSAEVIFAESCGCTEKTPMGFREYKQNMMMDNFYVQEISGIIKTMISDFSSAETFDMVVEILKKYVMWTDAQYFYLCMNELESVFPQSELSQEEFETDESVLKQGYSRYMTVPLAYEDGRFTTYGAYKKEEVLPKEVREGRRDVRYVMIPLHYQDESFGYCVFGNSNFPVDRDLCYTWILTISGALQNVRKNLQLWAMVKKLKNMWIYDTLTGVYNRAGFFHLAKPLVQEAKQEGRHMFLLFMDLDGLKLVNDNYGHEAGDRYICTIVEVLKRVIDEKELLMRYGGDEFAIMGKFRQHNRAEEIMREIEAAIAIENRNPQMEFTLALSMGCEAFNPQDEVLIEEILEMADQKMYKQKREKRENR